MSSIYRVTCKVCRIESNWIVWNIPYCTNSVLKHRTPGGHIDTQYTKWLPYRHSNKLAPIRGPVLRRQTLVTCLMNKHALVLDF